MRAWAADQRAVFMEGAKLIGVFWGAGVVGVVAQIGHGFYNHHRLQAPSWWWVVLFFVGWIVAQQRVIRQRRSGSQADPLDSSIMQTVQQAVTLSPGGVAIEAEFQSGQSLKITPITPPVVEGTIIQPVAQPANQVPANPGEAELG